MSNGLERKFHICMSNAVFCKYGWSWKEPCQGSWKELKMNPFGNDFWMGGDRELKFCRMMAHIMWAPCVKISGLYCQYSQKYHCFCVWNFLPKFAHAQFQWSLWASWIDFGGKFWILTVDTTFGGKPANGIQKTLNMLQKYNGLERKLFWNDWDKLSLFLIDGHECVQSLQQPYRVWPLWAKCQFLPVNYGKTSTDYLFWGIAY